MDKGNSPIMEMDNYLEKLIDISIRKKQALEKILDITKVQTRAIDQDEMELLNQCINDKQGYIETIDHLDSQFSKIYVGIKDKNIQGLKLHGKLMTLVSEIQGIIREISNIENTNDIGIKKAMENLKLKMRQLQTGKKGHTAYSNPS
ncbi:MAG TPA: flagellar protein FlgN, partial [Clostridia bacterium]|nr:flagellar protein FlgN [Clostridia bacterium]